MIAQGFAIPMRSPIDEIWVVHGSHVLHILRLLANIDAEHHARYHFLGDYDAGGLMDGSTFDKRRCDDSIGFKLHFFSQLQTRSLTKTSNGFFFHKTKTS